MTSKKQLLTYIALLLTVSWILQVIGIYVTGGVSSADITIWLAATMMSPLLVTIYFLYRNQELRQKLLWKPNKNIFFTSFLAILIPIIIGFAVVVVIEKLNYGQSEWFKFSNSGVTITEGPFLLGLGHQTLLFFSLNIFITGAVFAFINSFLAIGEELAWRGLLQPILIERYGLVRGVTFLGFIWSIWHLPILLNGYNYPEYPILGACILFPIRSIGTSYFYVWITQKSKSFIPATIAHGTLNGIQTAIIYNIKMNTNMLYEYCLTICLTVIIGVIFLCLSLKKNPNTINI